MDVVLSIFGDAVVDHVGDAGDVDAACGDVGGDEDLEFTGLEAGEGFHAVGLVDVRVHGCDLGLAGAFDHAGDLVCLAAGASEDHHRVVVGVFQ